MGSINPGRLASNLIIPKSGLWLHAHTAFGGPEGVDIANVGQSTMVLKHSSEGANLVQKNVRKGDLVDFKAECDLTAGAIYRYILHSRRESSLEI